MQGAHGAEVLRVRDLSRVALELLLGADGLPAAGRTVRRRGWGRGGTTGLKISDVER